MSFRLSKSELLERKQRWITNVLVKQKLRTIFVSNSQLNNMFWNKFPGQKYHT
jgi:hypothetical protein